MTDTGGQAEYLDEGVETKTDNRKRAIVLGGVVATAAVIGGAAWAATSFFATGAQPAEALPASTTVAYASIDLDPSGSQKIEAIRTLRKFPGLEEEMNFDADDDLREQLFAELTESGECEGLDFERDIDPWLGSRAAMAGVEGADGEVVPVGVIQVTDPGKAEDGMTNFVRVCGGDDEDASAETGPWIIEGDWMVVGEDHEAVEGVVEAAGEGSLADDDEFTRWTGEAGDPGILSVYVAAGAAEHFDDVFASSGMFFGPATMAGDPSMTGAIEDFEGMAMTVRFDDGALEIESAASANQQMQEFFASTVGMDLVASLPEDTVAALGMGLKDGWVDAIAEQIATAEGEDTTVEDLYAEASEATGLDLPTDLEKLFGEGMTVALGDGIDADALANGGVLELPIGVKIKGDPDDVRSVLDKIEPQLGPDEQGLLESAASDDYVAMSPDDAFREELAEDGSLGDNEVFEDLVGDSGDAQAVVFVNFNADDDWLVRVADDIDPTVAENLAPLSALGVSSWFDDGVGHGVVRLTTD